ncbi:class I SAM-dependent methyltransferase [Jannaschia marina]|uniref:class I SAM-dependent methyltransferase n=1 Tax=Jannaschia marina TaxID=2741674 RepID=UPI0015C9FCD7|nr:class I SAM-dependent methyltransferase [Jannaschia marina]
MTGNIYDPAFVADVFDRCSPAYRRWSMAASFGVIHRWRAQCVAALDLPRDSTARGVDLMAGTGEIWPHLLRRFPGVSVTAIDISPRMHAEAMERLHRDRTDRIAHHCANWLESDLPDASAGFAVSTFGLKTFDAGQHRTFARQLARVLEPDAPYALIEATDPVGWSLRPLYRLHLDGVLPLVERIALRGAQDFSMIGTYTRNFGTGETVIDALHAEGLAPKVTRLIGGCALLLSGRAPG